MNEKPKSFMGFVNPFGKGKKAESVNETADIPVDTDFEDTPDYAEEDQRAQDNASESESMPDPDILKEFFEKFDEEYRKLQRDVINEVSDCRQMYRYEKMQADKYREKISARDVLEEIIPFLTDLKNAVDGNMDMEEFRCLFGYRYRALTKKLDKKGVKLLSHNKGAQVELTPTVRVNVIATDDPSLDGTAGEHEQIGCIIRGEEDDPIIEKLDLYQFDESLVKTLPSEEAQENTDVSSDEAASTDTNKKESEDESADDTASTDFILRFDGSQTLTLVRPLTIRAEDGAVITVIGTDTELHPGEVIHYVPDGADNIKKGKYTFLLGDTVLEFCEVSGFEFLAGIVMESNEILLVLYKNDMHRAFDKPLIKYRIDKSLIENKN